MASKSLKVLVSIDENADPELHAELLQKPARHRAARLRGLANRGLVSLSVTPSQSIDPPSLPQATETQAPSAAQAKRADGDEEHEGGPEVVSGSADPGPADSGQEEGSQARKMIKERFRADF